VAHLRPDAKFGPKHSYAARICFADKISVHVDLTGSGPLLHWIGKPYSEVVNGNDCATLNTTGLHIVSLTQMVDSNTKELESRDCTINACCDCPVALCHAGSVEIQQGARIKLPLRFIGGGSWNITYCSVALGERSKITVNCNDPSAELEVEDIGYSELLMVKSTVCKGDVLPPPIHCLPD
jgi:hypothetical protein